MKLAVGMLMLLLSFMLMPFNIQVERIPSTVMNKSFNATVITPKTYGKTSKKYSVVYVLHGWLNDYDSMSYHTEIGRLSDEYDFIIVMPDGNLNKWYFDSRINSEFRFGTYVGREVPEYIDKKYRTIKKRSARAVTGYSMGGFGAFNAVFNYPETFGNVGSLSGAVEISGFENKWNLRKVFGNYEENKDLLTFMKEALGDEVAEVKLSNKLTDDPVCLTAGEGISFEMEKVFANMPNQNPMPMKATRILEINPNHPIFETLKSLYATDKDKVKEVAEVLYDQACLIEGFAIKDPIAYSKKICELLVK